MERVLGTQVILRVPAENEEISRSFCSCQTERRRQILIGHVRKCCRKRNEIINSSLQGTARFFEAEHTRKWSGVRKKDQKDRMDNSNSTCQTPRLTENVSVFFCFPEAIIECFCIPFLSIFRPFHCFRNSFSAAAPKDEFFIAVSLRIRTCGNKKSGQEGWDDEATGKTEYDIGPFGKCTGSFGMHKYLIHKLLPDTKTHALWLCEPDVFGSWCNGICGKYGRLMSGLIEKSGWVTMVNFKRWSSQEISINR